MTLHLILWVLILGLAAPAGACTTFCVETPEGVLFGKNYDWNVEAGYLLVNPRGVEKTAFGESPATWTSRYGSVTFNQYGREFPCGGMNEAGLVVELMWLDGTRYPEPDSRPAVSVLQWIQYQLDTAATVDEVLASRRHLRIRGGTPLHYLVADPSGRAATIEFLDGLPVVHTGPSLPHAVLTNDTYERSLAFLTRLEGFGGDQPAPTSTGSLDRFAQAAAGTRVLAAVETGAVSEAFDLLGAVAQGSSTRWSIVYNLSRRSVTFRTRSNPERRFLGLEGLDFACGDPGLGVDLGAAGKGNLAGVLAPFDRASNRQLIEIAYRETSFLAEVPADVKDRLAAYPDSAVCAGTP